ncbi:hypothetical protein [Dactylosporangium sp. NPDC051484]|uniref:hypothetical protein n=1 Tax=Dactylosporangium sp. NPDC051484 TaxID=3154942 RepID=UPI00344E748B
MRTFSAWRGRADTYLVVPLVVLVLLLAGPAKEFITYGYWPAAVAKADMLLYVVAPLCAIAGAWEGGRFRRGGIRCWAVVRPMWRIVLNSLGPTLVMAAVGVALAVGVMAPAAASAPGLPDVRLIGVYLLVVTAHILVGYGLGVWLAPALALPISLGLSYVWLAYPAAIEPFWVRHLNGFSFESCCNIADVPATRALIGSTLVALGVVAAVLLALSGGRRLLAGAAATFVLAFGAAVTVVWPLGPEANQPRAGSPRCAGDRPALCLWPEQEAARGRIDAAARVSRCPAPSPRAEACRTQSTSASRPIRRRRT